jgi:hypothetical protein
MNSIRPLATITLLAVAGVYLYLKINETEPQLPTDVADWTLPAQVDIREQPVATSPLSALAYQTPASTSLTQEAPTFAQAATPPASVPSTPVTPPSNPGQQATTLQAAPSFQAAPGGVDSHGAQAPSGVDLTPVGKEAAASVVPQSTPTSTALPDLPPLPKIPAATTAQSTPPGTPEVTGEGPATADSQPDPYHGLSLTQTQPPSATSPPVAQPPASSPPQASLFGATRLAMQGALDRGELSQALLLLSDWYGDPSLAPEEKQEVDALLGQLAGSVIYSTEHRLEPSYLVQAGERLEDIAKKYSVPWQLLAKINGIDRPDQLQPGQKLKVLRGPFSALIDLGDRQLTVMLARRYAGKFAIDIDPQVTVEEGQWRVDQKLVTPGNLNMASSVPATSSREKGESGATEEQSLILSNTARKTGQIAILRGSGSASPPVATEPENRVIRLKTADVRDVFDILSVGSEVIIRR